MKTVLESDSAQITINHQGAELISFLLKENDLEFIWQGDPNYWARHSPILFPFVGRLKDDKYLFNNESYSMSQHGFARDLPFELEKSTHNSAVFLLKSNKNTLEMYPFEFELRLSYELIETTVTVGYEVKTNSNEMYFSIGGHPAFNIPIDDNTTFDDYYLHFSPSKSRFLIPLKGNLVDLDKKTLGQTNTDIQLNHQLFEKDAFILETKGKNTVAIKSEKTTHQVKLTYVDFPYLGIWSPYPKEAPFVCIEPWFGIADIVDTTGHLEEKLGINRLISGEVFSASYQIEIN